MRAIKFRGKIFKTNEWVYGFYYRHDPPLQCIGESDEEAIHYIVKTGFADWNMPRDIELVQIKIETLGQYSGVKDDFGKEVFEGDIVTSSPEYFDDEDVHIGEVKYMDGGYFIDDNGVLPPLFDETRRLKVIGNVYENPELLY